MGMHCSWRGRAPNLRRGFIAIYQGKEKHRIFTWVGNLCFQNAQICGISDFIRLGSAPGGGMDVKVII